MTRYTSVDKKGLLAAFEIAQANSYANPIPTFRFWLGRKNKYRSCKSQQASRAKSDAEMVLGSFVSLLVSFSS